MDENRGLQSVNKTIFVFESDKKQLNNIGNQGCSEALWRPGQATNWCPFIFLFKYFCQKGWPHPLKACMANKKWQAKTKTKKKPKKQKTKKTEKKGFLTFHTRFNAQIQFKLMNHGHVWAYVFIRPITIFLGYVKIVDPYFYTWHDFAPPRIGAQGKCPPLPP